MIDLDCGQLSAAIFHMLNGLLTGEAHKELSDHESAQGLEVWRSITVNLSDKGPHKHTTLLDRINCPPRAKSMQAMRGTLKEWENHLREYHAAGGVEYQSDELKNMLLCKMLPCDDKHKLTHREFADGAVGTTGESYAQLRQRVVDTIVREELENQARTGKILNADDREEHVYENEEGLNDTGEDMEDEELNNLFTAIDSGVLSLEAVGAIQRKIQRKGR